MARNTENWDCGWWGQETHEYQPVKNKIRDKQEREEAMPRALMLSLLSRNHSIKILLLGLGLGLWGAFPQPPRLVKELTKYSLVQYILVALLIYQGTDYGKRKAVKVSVVLTLVLFVVNSSLHALEFVVYPAQQDTSTNNSKSPKPFR